jgi:anti-sigma-K factor RskA
MSTQPPQEDDMQDLLGAYALDALDPGDRARVDDYLERTAAARAEVDELRETAAMLALSPGPTETAPPEIWARISERIAPGEAHAAAPVVDLASRRGVPWKFAAPIAIAAAIIVALLAYQVVDLRGQVDNNGVPTAERFQDATNAPGARQAALSGNGATLARVVVLPDGTGYLMNDDLSALDPQRTYQLWALVGNATTPKAISAGVLGADPHVAAFKISSQPLVGFALTEERNPGAVFSRHKPVAAGTLSA